MQCSLTKMGYFRAMIFEKENALQTAAYLLQIKAIKLQPSNPFVWASGWNSPIYCDNRLTLSYPPIRNFIRESFVKLIQEKYASVDAIVGVATGAVAIGALVAEQLNLPFAYVRPEAKGHGRKNQVEGHLEPNSRVVVIEDLISTGGSSLKAVEALKTAGFRVLGMAAIFSYGFPIASENFTNANCEVFTLSNYDHLLMQALKTGAITGKDKEVLAKWRKSPDTWQAQ
jgi:orotate phosphoribosyltransferase